jgi:hypothetical protein
MSVMWSVALLEGGRIVGVSRCKCSRGPSPAFKPVYVESMLHYVDVRLKVR